MIRTLMGIKSAMTTGKPYDDTNEQVVHVENSPKKLTMAAMVFVMANVAANPINSRKSQPHRRDFRTRWYGSVGEVRWRSLMRNRKIPVTPDVNRASNPIYKNNPVCNQVGMSSPLQRKGALRLTGQNTLGNLC